MRNLPLLVITIAVLIAAAAFFAWQQMTAMSRQLVDLNQNLQSLEAKASAAEQRAVEAEANARQAGEKAGEAAEKATRAAEREQLSEKEARQAAAARQAAEEAELQARAARERAESQAAAEAAARAAAEERSAAAEMQLDEKNVELLGAREETERAQQEAERAKQEVEEIRRRMERELDRMQRSLSRIAETRRTALGLVMTLDSGAVEFDFDRAKLRPKNRELLSRVAGVLLTFDGYGIQIFGHTDDVGSEAYNKKLSERRAGAVRTYLVEAGVDPAVMTTMGLGKSSPLVEGTDSASRQRNRRVELAIVFSEGEYEAIQAQEEIE